MKKTKYTYKRKRIIGDDGSVSIQKQREYSNVPRTPVANPVPKVQQTVTVKSKGTVKIGNVSLPINAESNAHYVPDNQYLVGCVDQMQAMAVGVLQNKAVLLTGETGTGKTTLVKELAHKTNNSLRQINLNGNTTVDEFVGKTVLNKDGTTFQKGILIDAMENGHWLLLDEVNAGLPEVLLVLNEVLLSGTYTLVEDNSQVVQAHPNFRVFGTMNPPETYVGTNYMNLATASRFKIKVQVPYAEAKVELDIIKSKLPSMARTTDGEIAEIIRLATDIRNGYQQQEYQTIISTRDIISWCEVNEHYGDLVQSAKYTVLGGCNNDDRTALESILKVYFSAPIDVKVEDGTMGMVYRKGNLIQVCDDNLEVSDSRNYDALGKAKSGSVFEVLQVKAGTIHARLMKGEVVANPDREQKTVTHRDTVKLGDLSKVSTRRVDDNK